MPVINLFAGASAKVAFAATVINPCYKLTPKLECIIFMVMKKKSLLLGIKVDMTCKLLNILLKEVISMRVVSLKIVKKNGL